MQNHQGVSARVIGAQIGATAEVVNHLLKEQGFLYGEPGAYGLTPKGMEYGSQKVHDNGYGGYARRSWETTHFSPDVMDVLDLTPEAVSKARGDISARRQAQRATASAAQVESDVRFQKSRTSRSANAVDHELDPQKILLVVAGAAVIAAIGYGTYKGVQWAKRKKSTSEDPTQGG